MPWPAVTSPPLADNEVHVWRVSAQQPARVITALVQLLAPDERARAGRFHFERDRRLYVVTRSTLRRLLGRYLAQPPETFGFSYSEHDKPLLPRVELSFNVAHAGEMALLAFCREQRLGVDIERLRPLADAASIARRFFSARENADFVRVPPEQQTAAFFNCWTRKEAFVKAVGEGLSHPLDTFDVTLVPGQPARLLEIDGSAAGASRWSMRALHPAGGYVGAVAVEMPAPKLSCFDFTTDVAVA